MKKEFDLLGMTEAAKFLGCNRHSISNKIKSGQFHYGVHYVCNGRQHLFSSEALTQWLKILPAKRKVKVQK
jgi:hypothetical protein